MGLTLEISLIIGFLLHLLGDYILQNDWLANNKTKAFLPAFIHAAIYSLPFLFIVPSYWWLLLQDRYSINFFIYKLKWIL